MTDAAAAAPSNIPPAAPVPALELLDFSDRVPPVMVKELRQGLRARMFIVPFLSLHALLVLAALQGTRDSAEFFWHCIVIMLVALLPMRNVGAMSEERQARTLDTLLLTRLTPWRIVSGKWCATFALALLTAVSVLPYLLVRYLHGGSSFVQEGASLAGLVFLSGAMTAVFTSLSTMGSGLTRHILAVITILLSYRFGAMAILSVPHTAPGMAAGITGLVIAGAVWVTTFFLWQAAATIASAAANLTTPRRLTTVAAVAVTGLLLWLLPDARDFGRFVLLFILVMSSLVETSDRLVWNPVADVAFARRGFAGHVASLMLYPGWATGVVFSIVLWGVTALIALPPARMETIALPVAFSFFPVCFAAPFFLRRYGGPALMILIALAAQVLVTLTSSLTRGQFDGWIYQIPTLPGTGFRPSMALVWAGVALLFALPSLFLLARRISRESNL